MFVFLPFRWDFNSVAAKQFAHLIEEVIVNERTTTVLIIESRTFMRKALVYFYTRVQTL